MSRPPEPSDAADASDADAERESDRSRPTAGARAVLASGILLGVVMLAVLLTDRRHMLAANFEVYRVAAETALAGGNFYDVAPERFPEFYYLYPPITIVPFLPFAAVGRWSGFLVHTALEIALALSLAALIARWIERHRPLAALDRALIAGFVVASIHSVPSLVYGQVNLRMALSVGVGLFLLERAVADDDSRLEGVAGVALGAAALLKVFPAAVGVWLLRLRAWRAVGAATATGLGGLALGAVAFGLDRTRTFFFEALLPRSDGEAFVGGLDPVAPYVTVRRPLSVLVDLEPTALSAVAAIGLLVPLGFVYAGPLETPVDRLVAAHATVLAVFVFFPSFPLYYVIAFATLLPLLYLLEDPAVRGLFLGGAGLANLAITAGTLEDVAAATPPAVGEPLLAIGTPILTLATPMLVGCLLMLAGCILYRFRRSGRSPE
ncbi:hypothetical protein CHINAEXTREME_05560 [Halobiforma lacisalsi AJ5]|uniref:DUF2029 domain-containing protein n=1 Tax=Natronobacterium lacisalsi AJ5 TaxID=358396 RepID=M0LJS2_NATLA|nr:glycosyltransferase family 87 protein [Halobiforma lacisalsi]APW97271.1 hypothetical protein CHINAEXTREME_05560 [Halobiforma lacisalsi AJ5]EMA33781.1 hypothetical protein C445_08834 [Halobiforma lacisalsi AJ5]